MAEIVNLRARRKAAERDARRRKGDENAAKFGRTKAQKAFREIAAEKGMPLNALAAQIDESRGLDVGLASAIRLFVLRHYRG